ncbi:CMRF35-like molecule 4 [Suricata suricatta]|uniref:CMRF35-like molecule 4 n=1 Tax=Suricata suricatta TaxID=37032 RepID=UPI00115554B5|nr:CMRF35-like molecule 4 [Suricata suricatta]
MWLFLVLFLPVVQASSAITARPTAVSGSVKGSLTVQCLYEPGWETYKKWWCQGAEWSNCHILVKTNGSEQEVKGKRVSIQDNQKTRTFTITMEDLRLSDQDIYWCGIEKSGTDLGDKVNVSIDPVAVECHYGPQWETYVKSWCQDADPNGCTIFVEIQGSKKKYVTINEKEHTFSMFVRGK